MKLFAIALFASLVVAGFGGQAPASAPAAAPTAAAPAEAPTSALAAAAPTVQSAVATPAPAADVAAVAEYRPTTPPATALRASFAQLVGQKLVVRMDGTTASADLLGRIRRGEVGGVILLGFNIATPAQVRALTAQLRAAAAAGGQPRLLIGVDQEGGSVKRIPWAPPTLSAPQMGRMNSATTARTQGANTAAALRGLGINVDFAPVADVPASTTSFMYRAGRTFSFNATRTAVLADAFATGLESKGVLPTMKHFPGIGFATRNTDSYVVSIGATRAALAPGLLPYRTAIAHHIPLIMLSNATYTAYDTVNAAGWSRAIQVNLLRQTLGFTGVTITDSLDGTAHARGLPTSLLAVRAARAGTDMILMTGSEATTKAVYATLLADAKSGYIQTDRLRASYTRILALKARL
jgi:beta-N-acetylhexosaminidase